MAARFCSCKWARNCCGVVGVASSGNISDSDDELCIWESPSRSVRPMGPLPDAILRCSGLRVLRMV